MKEEDKTTLKVLFAGEEQVEVAPGITISVHPISLHDLVGVIDKVEALLNKKRDAEVAGQYDAASFGMTCIKEIFALIPYCTDADLTTLPGTTALPALIEKILEQNLAEVTVGKWSALGGKVMELMGGMGKLNALINAEATTQSATD